MITTADTPPIQEFIKRWAASSGAERANFQMFAMELCRLLEVPPPHPSKGEDAELNDYCFERGVQFKEHDGTTAAGRIDLYKRGAFVMEAKQSREKGRPKELKLAGQPDLFVPDYKPRGERSANRAWDQLMISARHQAQEYARALPTSHGWPPFVLVCDVGHCIEVYADFSGQGKNYAQFPDRQGFRIYLKDLEDPKIRERLKLIWENPTALDPARQSAKVTREIAARLAEVSKGLEKRGHNAEDVALFLMRCLFTMFAEDVELLPAESFEKLLLKCVDEPKKFVPLVEQLWAAMDKGEFAYAIEKQVMRFNGKLFKTAMALELLREEIGELAAAAKYKWKEVEPAIFGTLLEQALNEKERARLGAHYTPRAYVERLVVVTVMEPLRQEWAQVQATAERFRYEADALEAQASERAAEALKSRDQSKLDRLAALGNEAKRTRQQGVATLLGFHEKLCATRVLDPACGTGNFLYVSMELMKRLEGEVLEALMDLGGQEALALDKHSVDPHQFLGLELNPRAAAIAELVIWLGYLQWHFRTKGGVPNEPILRDFQNIKVMDAVLTWDGYPLPKIERRNGQSVETYPNAKRPPWPEAEYIVGNPPFIGKGEPMREAFTNEYIEALSLAHPSVGGSADFVMYWWDVAAQKISRQKSIRFGLVTTNSIDQIFNRRVVANWLNPKQADDASLRKRVPISLVMAIADHPWRKKRRREPGEPSNPEFEKFAAVRIAMTVGERGYLSPGTAWKVEKEEALDTDQPVLHMLMQHGRINSDLSVGVDVTTAEKLRANAYLASMGPALGGRGFVLTQQQAEALPGRKWRRRLTTGRDITGRHRNRVAINVSEYETEEQLRAAEPHVYQHLKQTVFPSRATNNDPRLRQFWWRYRRSNDIYFGATSSLKQFIATVETTKHRLFVLVSGDEMLEHGVVGIGLDDAYYLGVLSSSIHVVWTLANGGTLEDRPRYNKDVCFETFPFPECGDQLKRQIRSVSEELDSHRKKRLAEHADLTLTDMYNVLEKLRIGLPLEQSEEQIKEHGLLIVLKDLHSQLDNLVSQAYGWPQSASEEETLQRLLQLNVQRATEEKAGTVRWLRPNYQMTLFGSSEAAETSELALGDDEDESSEELESKTKFPTGNELAETAAVMGVLASASDAMTIAQIARTFSQGKQIEKRVALTILALARLGHLSSTDGGETFMLRRVA